MCLLFDWGGLLLFCFVFLVLFWGVLGLVWFGSGSR